MTSVETVPKVNQPEKDDRGRWTAICQVHYRRRNLECLSQEADGSYACLPSQRCRSGKDVKPRTPCYLCPDCNVILNSKQQAHVHLLGFRHQDRIKQLKEEYSAKGLKFIESSLVLYDKDMNSELPTAKNTSPEPELCKPVNVAELKQKTSTTVKPAPSTTNAVLPIARPVYQIVAPTHFQPQVPIAMPAFVPFHM